MLEVELLRKQKQCLYVLTRPEMIVGVGLQEGQVWVPIALIYLFDKVACEMNLPWEITSVFSKDCLSDASDFLEEQKD